MFCDLVGSTALSEALDPEDLCEIVRQHQRVCTRVIEAYDGHVAQFLGDGILVYFGYPRVHEDDARRAVHAAIEMVREVAELEVPLLDSLGGRLQLRIGVHTGLTVVGEVGGGRRRERLAVGETPNVAARVQATAAPGTIAASQATYALVRGFVECEELGEHYLKGISRPFALYRVLAASGAQTRLDAATVAGLTPYVGRTKELGELLACWSDAVGNRARAVLLEGEPGLGKSRLIGELRERLQPSAAFVFACTCAVDSENSALRPLIESIERELGLRVQMSVEEKHALLQNALDELDNRDPEAFDTLASLLSLPSRGPESETTPAKKRQRTLAFLVRWLKAFTQRGPVLLIFEDLHWADPSTLEYIGQLLAECEHARLLLLLTHRPEFKPPWPQRSFMRRIALAQLPAADVLQLIAHIAGDTPLTEVVSHRILQRTDGVPLFIEELTRSVLENPELRETQASGLEPAIPTSIQDLLSARLERLGPARATAQLAATIGREFGVELLAQVRGCEPAVLEKELEQLVQAKLIRRLLGGPYPAYAFRHALIRDAAYHSLLRHTRREYHRMVADALREHFGQMVTQRPELLARHYAGARMFMPAVEYFAKAAQGALERSANLEASAHAREGLSLVQQLRSEDPSSASDASELGLLMCLGPALIATTGFASDDVGEVYERARTLCEQLPNAADAFAPLWGSWVFRLVRGELQLARETAERMLALGERTESSAVLVEAHWTLGNALFWMGDLRDADAHLQRAALLYDRKRHHGHAFRFGQDPGVATGCYRAFALCLSGEVAQSRAVLSQAAALAAELEHPFTSAWVEAFHFMVSMFLREPQAALASAQRTIDFSARERHPFWLASATVVSGWAQARLGALEAGLVTMQQGLNFYDSTGSGVVQPLWYALLAEVLLADGRWADTDAALRVGYAKAERHGEELAKIELLRLRGELLGCQDDIPSARAALRQALALAEQRGAHTLALRCALQLHRHLDEGELDPLALLVPRFATEPEYPDLVRARAIPRATRLERLH